MATDSTPVQFVSGARASRVLGCNVKQVPKLAGEGFITVRRVPGSAPRYLLADVERLARQWTVPATIHVDSEPVTSPTRPA